MYIASYKKALRSGSKWLVCRKLAASFLGMTGCFPGYTHRRDRSRQDFALHEMPSVEKLALVHLLSTLHLELVISPADPGHRALFTLGCVDYPIDGTGLLQTAVQCLVQCSLSKAMLPSTGRLIRYAIQRKCLVFACRRFR